MASKLSITSVNSQFTLVVPSVFPVPQILQQYAVDDAFTTEAVDIAEAIMGVDGKMAAGYTPFITSMTIHLQANSISLAVFEAWAGAMRANQEIATATATIVVPSIGHTYACLNGVLTGYTPVPAVKKVLAPVVYTIKWELVTPALI